MTDEATIARARGTATSNFGVGRRESHDASGFYGRFEPPVLDDDTTVPAPRPIAEPFVVGDARTMDAIADGSVALVVTSPPYFAGKQYEEELERDGVPSSYLEYLELLHDVFADCVRVLEPGGRIAVNVANLGRKPFRSLAADVIHILQDRLGLLLRGEIVWQKGAGASGSCAWGSFRSPSSGRIVPHRLRAMGSCRHRRRPRGTPCQEPARLFPRKKRDHTGAPPACGWRWPFWRRAVGSWRVQARDHRPPRTPRTSLPCSTATHA